MEIAKGRAVTAPGKLLLTVFSWLLIVGWLSASQLVD